MTSLRRFLESSLVRLGAVGADPGDDQEMRLRKALLVLIALLILPVSLVWAALYRIQITAATYALLKDEFVCERRGTISLKGKGQMETWYLLRRS